MPKMIEHYKKDWTYNVPILKVKNLLGNNSLSGNHKWEKTQKKRITLKVQKEIILYIYKIIIFLRMKWLLIVYKLNKISNILSKLKI